MPNLLLLGWATWRKRKLTFCRKKKRKNHYCEIFFFFLLPKNMKWKKNLFAFHFIILCVEIMRDNFSAIPLTHSICDKNLIMNCMNCILYAIYFPILLSFHHYLRLSFLILIHLFFFLAINVIFKAWHTHLYSIRGIVVNVFFFFWYRNLVQARKCVEKKGENIICNIIWNSL